MTFDVAQLKDRAQELHDIQHRLQIQNASRRFPTFTKWADPAAILTIYDPFLDIPTPDSYGAITDQLHTAMSHLATTRFAGDQGTTSGGPELVLPNTDLDEVGAFGIEIDNWSGEAAKAFNENYATKFPDTIASQYSAYWVLRNAVNAEAAVWQTTRDDLDKLSADAISQMKQVNACSKAAWEAFLSIIGAVVTVAGAIPTAGASLELGPAVGAGVAVASTGMSVSDGAAGDPPDDLGLSHGSPFQVVQSLQDALDKVRGYIADGEQKICDAVRTANDTITNGWAQFCLPEPALASMSEAGTAYGYTQAGTYR